MQDPANRRAGQDHPPQAAAHAARSLAVACALYEAALGIMAQRAGAAYTPDVAHVDAALIARAQALALPQQRANTPEPPVLVSIMGRVHGQNQPGYYRPGPLANAAAIPLPELPTELRAATAEVWQVLAAERDEMASASASSPADSLLVQERRLHAWLQRHAWAVAAPATPDLPPGQSAVSLYDYARTSAALAVCLDAGQPAADAAQKRDEEPVWLVGGDLSGVQEWLYTFGSTGAAKSLRGRSFYLQLLTEVIAQYLLDRLGLPLANLLYAGGGNFYLLIPHTLAGAVAELQKEISRRLLHMHNGALYIALATAPLPLAALQGAPEHPIGQAWDNVARKLNVQKSRRFAELEPAEMAAAIGSPLENTGQLDDTCRVCRRAITPGETGEPVEDDQGGRTCDLCLSFAQLGNLLPRAEFLVMSRIPPVPAGPVTAWNAGLRQLGFDVQVVHHVDDVANSSRQVGAYLPPAQCAWTTLYFGAGPRPPADTFPGRLPADPIWAVRPLAQCTPYLDATNIATFDQLQSEGIPRWGVLRMDVDNLGQIFQRGIPAQNLCNVVAVSGLLRHFFEGYVPRLAGTFNEIGHPRVYLMYAGGDDLFVVGGWSHLPELAAAIRAAFGEFVCHNPKVTISGGISIALDSNYPLYQAARSAGGAEHAAKDYGKNALTFLGQPLAWDGEFDQARRRQTQLRHWRNTLGFPRAFLSLLATIDSEWRHAAHKHSEHYNLVRTGAGKARQIYLGAWQWHLLYSLTRFAGRLNHEARSATQAELAALPRQLLAGEIFTIGLSTRWADLLDRADSSHGKEAKNGTGTPPQ